MELHVKKGKIPQLMIDKTELKDARFYSKRVVNGKTMYMFMLPESIVVEKPKRVSKKKKEVADEIKGADNSGEVVNESE